MNRIVFVLASLLIGFGGVEAVGAAEGVLVKKKSTLRVDAPGEAKIIAIKMHADWCASCKELGPRLTDLRNMFDQKPVLFVEMDYTNRSTQFHSQLLAKALGVSKLVRDNRMTGVIVLADQKGNLLERLTSAESTKEMAMAIDKRLANIH